MLWVSLLPCAQVTFKDGVILREGASRLIHVGVEDET